MTQVCSLPTAEEPRFRRRGGGPHARAWLWREHGGFWRYRKGAAATADVQESQPARDDPGRRLRLHLATQLFWLQGAESSLRVDGHFQRPVHAAFRLLGFEFGPGLLVSSLFFGLIHALNTVDYFGGRFDFGWGYGLQNVFTGLFFGFVRAKTGSVMPGAIVHGLEDAFARIPNLLP
jgi:hypothetical protein